MNILLIILLILLLGGGGLSLHQNWGYGPPSIMGVLILIIVLRLLGLI